MVVNTDASMIKAATSLFHYSGNPSANLVCLKIGRAIAYTCISPTQRIKWGVFVVRDPTNTPRSTVLREYIAKTEGGVGTRRAA
jgi:hypothetical protein